MQSTIQSVTARIIERSAPLRGPYLDMVRDAVTSDAFRERRLVQPDYVDRLLADPEGEITPLRGSKLWQVGVLALWLEAHGRVAA